MARHAGRAGRRVRLCSGVSRAEEDGRVDRAVVVIRHEEGASLAGVGGLRVDTTGEESAAAARPRRGVASRGRGAAAADVVIACHARIPRRRGFNRAVAHVASQRKVLVEGSRRGRLEGERVAAGAQGAAGAAAADARVAVVQRGERRTAAATRPFLRFATLRSFAALRVHRSHVRGSHDSGGGGGTVLCRAGSGWDDDGAGVELLKGAGLLPGDRHASSSFTTSTA